VEERKKVCEGAYACGSVEEKKGGGKRSGCGEVCEKRQTAGSLRDRPKDL
jgi:hypothetical protein